MVLLFFVRVLNFVVMGMTCLKKTEPFEKVSSGVQRSAGPT